MFGIKVALLQFDIQLGNPAANREKVQKMLGEAVCQGAKLVALPELWTHLFSLMDEDKFFAAGDEVCVVDTPFGKAGTVICYDIR